MGGVDRFQGRGSRFVRMSCNWHAKWRARQIAARCGFVAPIGWREMPGMCRIGGGELTKGAIAITGFLALIDPIALSLVWIGSFCVVGLQEGWRGLCDGFSASRVLLRIDPDRDASEARRLIYRAQRIVDLKGVQCVDRLDAKNGFAAKAIAHIANRPGDFSQWASFELNEREQRHNRVIRFWLAIAETAPAIGMIGTIFGLIRMFANSGDALAAGAAMAMALLTTLYGLVLANVVAAPIAQRLLRLSSEELKWQRVLSDRLIDLAEEDGAALRAVA